MLAALLCVCGQNVNVKGTGNHELVDAMQWKYDGMVDNAARDYLLSLRLHLAATDARVGQRATQKPQSSPLLGRYKV